MQSFLGGDAHKHYSVFVAVDERGKATPAIRIEHNVAAYQRYLDTLPNGTEIAIESTGNWYWIVDLMEQAGHRPHLANPSEAKKRMGKTHKTDALDAKGLAILLRNGTLPESWIPPGGLRDQRELLRTRMPSPATWPRRAIGCCASVNLTANRSLIPLRPSSGQRETLLTRLHRSRGECEARSKNAHARHQGEYMACGRTPTARAKLDECQPKEDSRRTRKTTNKKRS
jgi:hypothetical protein